MKRPTYRWFPMICIRWLNCANFLASWKSAWPRAIASPSGSTRCCWRWASAASSRRKHLHCCTTPQPWAFLPTTPAPSYLNPRKRNSGRSQDGRLKRGTAVYLRFPFFFYWLFTRLLGCKTVSSLPGGRNVITTPSPTANPASFPAETRIGLFKYWA